MIQEVSLTRPIRWLGRALFNSAASPRFLFDD
jgi:hypothetical protein